MKNFRISFRKLLVLALASLVLVVIVWNQPSRLDVSPTRSSDTKAATVSDKPIPRSLFGMHIGSPDKIPWPAVPIATWRIWDVAGRAGMAFWAHLEPQQGKWDFRTLDDSVELAQSKGIASVLILIELVIGNGKRRPNTGQEFHPLPITGHCRNQGATLEELCL